LLFSKGAGHILDLGSKTCLNIPRQLLVLLFGASMVGMDTLDIPFDPIEFLYTQPFAA
jgi:hypothetical protein